MKLKVVLHSVIIIVLFTANGFGETKSEGEDTGQSAYLEIDGKEYELLIGKMSQLTIGDKQYAVNIRLAPYRVFNSGVIYFKFPSGMHYSLDNSDPNVKLWSIDGDNSLIMVQEFYVPIDKFTLINAFRDQYVNMKANVDKKEIKLEARNKVFDGTHLSVKMGDVGLSQEIYIIRKGSRTNAIILQDTLDDGNNTLEYLKMRNIFKESFRVK